jgi:hypothetical protein
MKKAKITLAAIAVMGIVGGSLAFTAKKSTVGLYTAPLGNPVCTYQTGITTVGGVTPVNAFLPTEQAQVGQTHACAITTLITVNGL